MNSKKIIITALSLFTLGLVSFLGAQKAMADENNGHRPITQKIAEKFNLNPDEVNKVFEENHKKRQEKMRANFEERLNKAVEEKKITEEQKNAVLEKKKEMWSKQEQLKDLPVEQRREEMKKIREEFRNWMDQSGIDLSQVLGKGFRSGLKGGGFGPGECK